MAQSTLSAAGIMGGPNAHSAQKTGTQKVDLYNPTPARRVIFDGINVDGQPQKSITIHSGETKRGVTLSDFMVKEIKDRTKGVGKDKADLVILAPGSAAPKPAEESTSGDDEDDGA